MVQNHLVLLPGLDGTGELFTPMLNCLTNHFTTSVVSYPTDKLLNYQQLIPRIREVIPWDEPYTLVAESFSGPLALLFAAVQPENIKAIVLAASFACNPMHPLWDWGRFLVKDSWMQKPLPERLVKKLLIGEDCPDVLANAILQTLRSVRPEVLAYRLRMIMDTDARPALRACEKPILCLAGTQDKISGKRALTAMLAVKPDLVLSKIEAPHLILQRRPAEALAAIEKFLADQEHLQPKPWYAQQGAMEE
jgi:pimeloyl-ACP methyl ester carboxylesterase